MGLNFKTRGRGFGPEVKRRDHAGRLCAFVGLLRRLLPEGAEDSNFDQAGFRRGFRAFDALLAPTSPTVAFPIGARTDDPVAMYLSDVCTIPVNLAGLPGISIPCGFSDRSDRSGFRSLAERWTRPMVLRVANAYEQARRTGRRSSHR